MSKKNIYTTGTLAMACNLNPNGAYIGLAYFVSKHPVTNSPLDNNPYIGAAHLEKWPFDSYRAESDQLIMLLSVHNSEAQSDWIFLRLLVGEHIGWTHLDERTWRKMVYAYQEMLNSNKL